MKKINDSWVHDIVSTGIGFIIFLMKLPRKKRNIIFLIENCFFQNKPPKHFRVLDTKETKEKLIRSFSDRNSKQPGSTVPVLRTSTTVKGLCLSGVTVDSGSEGNHSLGEANSTISKNEFG